MNMILPPLSVRPNDDWVTVGFGGVLSNLLGDNDVEESLHRDRSISRTKL